MAVLVMTCVDGRLKDSLRALEARLDAESADRLQVPGGPLAYLRSEHERVSILEWLEFMVPARGVDTMFLVSHEDCLAYRRKLSGLGGHSEDDVLRRDLATVKGQLDSRLRGILIECYIIPKQGERYGSAMKVS